MSELVKISTKTYNSQLDEISNNDVDVYVKAKLKKRLTYGEYVGEPNNGFELVFGDTVSIMNLDKSMVYIHSKNNLNENQQIVLDWFKDNYHHKYSKGREVFWALSMFATNSMYVDFGEEPAGVAYSKLSNQQFAQVLEVFAKWAQEQEGDTE